MLLLVKVWMSTFYTCFNMRNEREFLALLQACAVRLSVSVRVTGNSCYLRLHKILGFKVYLVVDTVVSIIELKKKSMVFALAIT